MAQSSVETYPVMSIAEHFGRLTDPRMEERVEHRLLDIIVIAICGVICGADSWVEIEEFGKAKQDWLKGFLDLPNGIPSHDTFGRVFACLSAFQFQACFMSWIEAVFRATEGQVVAIDGKRVRGSYDRGSNKAAIHRVSAWACANRVVLGQVKTEEKSNEITAIPELLKLLEPALLRCIRSGLTCQKQPRGGHMRLLRTAVAFRWWLFRPPRMFAKGA
jgi:DDE_Tnp_1-associated